MALITADRVKDLTTTTGTGSLTLSGSAPIGYQTFASVMATGDSCYYCIVGAAEWEVGLGTLTASTTLARTTVLSSSNSNAAVSFSAGSKEVFITLPSAIAQPLANQSVYAGGANVSWGTLTYSDEFSDPSLNANWVKVDPTGQSAYVSWTQAGNCLTAVHTTGTDAAASLHSLLIPIGSAFAVGDALVTCYKTAALAGNYTMVGLALSNGTTWGTSNLVETETYINGSSVQFRCHTASGMNTDGANPGIALYPVSPLYVRLVMTAANTWRADYSSNGILWASQAAAVSYTLTPTHMGFTLSNWATATPSVTSFEFFRRYSGVS